VKNIISQVSYILQVVGKNTTKARRLVPKLGIEVVGETEL
jgi:hypothetical protein